MNQEDAKKFINRLGVLLCLDVPDGTEFGIDYHFWEIGPKFKGVKLIPIGIHYVFYCVKNKYGGDSSPRTSFFINIKENDVIVKKWDKENEELVDVDEDIASRYIEGVRRFDFDQNLGAYPLEHYSRWRRLSNFITPELVDRIQPIGGSIDSSSMPLTDREKKLIGEYYKDDDIQNLRKNYYVHIPKHITDKDPKKILQLNFDKSYLFEKIIKEEFKGDTNMLLGEMEYAFICFLLGQSFESFKHWKEILNLVLNCEESLKKKERASFFLSFMDTLKNQLKEISGNFFNDIIAEYNFLHYLLSGFFEIAENDDVPVEVRKKCEKLKKFAEKRFNVKFRMDEFDEYAPTYVD